MGLTEKYHDQFCHISIYTQDVITLSNSKFVHTQNGFSANKTLSGLHGTSSSLFMPNLKASVIEISILVFAFSRRARFVRVM